MKVTFDTSTWESSDAEILQAIAKILEEKGNAAEISDAPTSTTIVTQIETETQDINAHDAQDVQETHREYQQCELSFKSPEEEMRDILSELGLKIGGKGANKSSRNRSAKVISCYDTILKYYKLLGAEKFKFAISAIRNAWPKGWNGKQWHRLIIKDVCIFVYEYWNTGLDLCKLSASLSKSITSDRFYSPDDFLNRIDVERGGLATRERYNTYIKIKENKLKDSDKISAERGN